MFDFEQFDTKRNDLEQKMRVENLIFYKLLHRAKMPHQYWDAGGIDCAVHQSFNQFCVWNCYPIAKAEPDMLSGLMVEQPLEGCWPIFFFFFLVHMMVGLLF